MKKLNISVACTCSLFILFAELIVTSCYGLSEEVVDNPHAALIDCFWGISSRKSIEERKPICEYLPFEDDIFLVHSKNPILGVDPVPMYRSPLVKMEDCFWKASARPTGAVRRMSLIDHPFSGTFVYTTSPEDREMLVGYTWYTGEIYPWIQRFDYAKIDSLIIKDALEGKVQKPNNAPSVLMPGIKIEGSRLSLEGDKGVITDEIIREVFEKPTHFKSVSLERCGLVTDDGIETIAAYCSNLDNLWLFKCGGISDRGIEAIASVCPHLTQLTIAPATKITDKSIKAIATHCHKLRWLTLGVYDVTDDSIRAIVSDCPELTRLALNQCPNITDYSFLEFPETSMLKSLQITGCLGINGVCFGYLPKTITELTLLYSRNGNKNLINLDGLINLEKLTLPDGSKFSESEKIRQYLRQLRLSKN